MFRIHFIKNLFFSTTSSLAQAFQTLIVLFEMSAGGDFGSIKQTEQCIQAVLAHSFFNMEILKYPGGIITHDSLLARFDLGILGCFEHFLDLT